VRCWESVRPPRKSAPAGRAGRGRPESVRQRQCSVYGPPTLPHPVEKVRNPARFGFVCFSDAPAGIRDRLGTWRSHRAEVLRGSAATSETSQARLARQGWETVGGVQSGIRPKKARNSAGFGFVWCFRAQVRAQPGRTFAPYLVQEFYPICAADATPIRTFPVRRHAMRHLPVTPSDFRDTRATQRTLNLNPV
jgi:hypothetical protein